MAVVLLSAILGITANSWFVQADSSVIQDDQQEPDNEAPDSDKVTEGTDTYKGFLLDNVLHSSEEGDIHYNVYIPDSYDGSKPYALFFTLPGYEGLYFQGVGVNIKAEGFGFAAQEYNPEMIIVDYYCDYYLPLFGKEGFVCRITCLSIIFFIRLPVPAASPTAPENFISASRPSVRQSRNWNRIWTPYFLNGVPGV